MKKQQKTPVQLDLFLPHSYDYEFKVIVTNKTCGPKKVLRYHNGRGAQENLFSELKTDFQMDYVPTRTLVGNQTYMICAILGHNLMREMHFAASSRNQRRPQETRELMWRAWETGSNS